MDFLYKDKERQDFELVQEVCHSVLSQKIEENKPFNNEWGAIYVEGRDRRVGDIESYCALKSFKLFSKYNAPIYCFLHNDKDFFGHEYGLIDKWNIKIIKIPLLDSLEEYSEFCIRELYFMLPGELRYAITLQADGMLLKPGFEDFVLNNKLDWVSPHWKHQARVEITVNENWIPGDVFGFTPTAIGNGGFSFRNVSKIQDVSRQYNYLKLREFGRGDNRPPMEDLFFTYFGFNDGIMKKPTLKQCDEFAVDPLTRDIWEDKSKWPFGFHYFRAQPEFPPCNHG